MEMKIQTEKELLGDILEKIFNFSEAFDDLEESCNEYLTNDVYEEKCKEIIMDAIKYYTSEVSHLLHENNIQLLYGDKIEPINERTKNKIEWMWVSLIRPGIQTAIETYDLPVTEYYDSIFTYKKVKREKDNNGMTIISLVDFEEES